MAGYRYWADQEVLTHTDVNGYLMSQAVPRFVTAEERSAQMGTPVAGQLSYVTGVGLQLYDGTEWTEATGPAGPAGPDGPTGPTGDPGPGIASYTTAGRPTAAAAGAGTVYYDTTDSWHMWSDGTTWRRLFYGIAKADVGLGSVDNTTDAGKPVSTAQQTALDLKANLTGATFTGQVNFSVNIADRAFNVTNTHASGDGWGVTLNNSGRSAFRVVVSGEASSRFYIEATGKMWWGPGSATQDVNLYRSAVDTLRTDDAFEVAGAGINLVNSAPTILADAVASGSVTGVFIGNRVAGDAQRRFYIRHDGMILIGPGGSTAPDVNLYRGAANVLATDDRIDAGGGLKVIGNVGFYGTAIQAKQTVTGARSDGSALASLLTALATVGLLTDSSTA